MCLAGHHFDITALGLDVLAYLFVHTCPMRESEVTMGDIV